MKILILGGDGYLGWPTAMHLSKRGHDVALFDSFSKRKWELELGVEPLVPISSLHRRVKIWKSITGKDMRIYVGDLTSHRTIYKALDEFKPDVIVHYAEQPSAPYSMMGRYQAVETQQNNVLGTLNLLHGMKKYCPKTHLVKLGTMGEYGTPNIDIEEGFIEIEHRGRKDILPFPKQPGSFYHLSKVHDSHNIQFACKVWGIRSTDLNQGIVYGLQAGIKDVSTLNTSFHYDAVFGTVLNRFVTQAVIGIPLTVYGKGNQKRGFLNIRDTLQCVELALINPAQEGEYRVFNQFTETFTLNQLAELVKNAGNEYGLNVQIEHLDNPRIEAEEHYYNPVHQKLTDLGLEPVLLSDALLNDLLRAVNEHKYWVDPSLIRPTVQWRQN